MAATTPMTVCEKLHFFGRPVAGPLSAFEGACYGACERRSFLARPWFSHGGTIQRGPRFPVSAFPPPATSNSSPAENPVDGVGGAHFAGTGFGLSRRQ